MSSQYLISTRWMSRRVLLRSSGRCCLGLVAVLLVAGAAAEVLPVSLNCPLPLRRTHPPTLVSCCFCVFAAMGVTSTKSGRLEVNLSLSGKRAERSCDITHTLLEHPFIQQAKIHKGACRAYQGEKVQKR